MSQKPVIALIGSGVMGEAMAAGLLKNQIVAPENLHASDNRPERVEEMQLMYRVRPFTDNVAAVQGADVVLLAVKPQRVDRVLAGLRNRIPPEAVLISIVAGTTIENISTALNHDAVVRAMPNTPGQIGEGITVWVGSESVSEAQLETTRLVLSALGQEIMMEDESYLDMATALSGTGPAYVFLFMEAMIDAGVHLGFPRRVAEQLVEQTVRGSVDYFTQKKIHPATLRNQVTSPGGTSAAALYYLEKAGFRTAISRAIWAAYERSVELGKGKNTQAPENPGSSS